MNHKILGTIVGLAALLGVAGVQENRQPADQAVKTVGILQYMSHPALTEIYHGIEQGLQDEGYQVGKNINIDLQNAQGDQSNLKTMAAHFASTKPAVTVGIATPAAVSLVNTMQQQPVVFAGSTNPVGAKLVPRYQHPGGNVTGVSDQAPLQAQLKLMQTLVPSMHTVGVIYTSSDDSATTEARKFMRLAQKHGIKIKAYSIASTNDLNQTSLQMLQAGNVDAAFVPTDNTIAGAIDTLMQNAKNVQIPVFPTVDSMVEKGGLASESISQKGIGRATGHMVGHILSGAKPGDQDVEFMQQGNLVINQTVADELQIKIPDNLRTKAKMIK
ncbi:hypothetical protein IV73_GL000021 [Weissella kandleri]|uniref:ABC transporter substrate-binding protein n=1 Tax=Weissella kandleri TaxID=1616 RepID=A0A0R2JN54_9LACO|nr:tryptophan ABC transporter substrate-binding protein [Weissella kandleri]KRN75540.1 hypothetical protein IV73_GL000021 [Weissella kandleri]